MPLRAAASVEGLLFTQVVPDTLPAHPLPGGVAEVVRLFFHVPQWIQIGGAVVAGILALALLFYLWRKRGAIVEWLRTRALPLQVGLGLVAVAVLAAAAAAGAVSWSYMQHANEFCTGCHVMADPYRRFVESEHADLSCHECHQQSLYASARQLYLWVADRPEEIGPHAPVPNEICAACHIRRDPGERWERIAATAGHRVHLESGDPELAGVLCVTCHGEEVHRFVPADATCGQAGCHEPTATRIVIGEMAEQTGLHCVLCHEFTAEIAVAPDVPAVDTLLGPLVPGRSQCLQCHDMTVLVSAFALDTDPHQARCGACHDPHAQESPDAAFATCTAAGCHETPLETSPFHRGIREAVLRDCGACHPAHGWVVDGLDCASCHAEVAGTASRAAGSGSRVAGSARTAIVLAAAGGGAVPEAGGGAVPEAEGLRARQEFLQEFDHRTHRSVACTECHASERVHGEVTVRTPADCRACHHGPGGMAAASCEGCHRSEELRAALSVPTRVELSVWEGPRRRSLPFDHPSHADLACGRCHIGDRLRAEEAACGACHGEHHPAAATTRCISCHEEHRTDAHTARVHVESCAGSGCHSNPPYPELRDSRAFCLSCHQDQEDHEPGGRCMECHRVRAGPTSTLSGPSSFPR